jgi:hypothetical protein
MTNNVISLAHSIPVAETIHGVGELVFPRLIQRLHDIGCEELIPLVEERNRLGIAKHGQPLRTGDGRHTPTEIMGEMLDGAVYGEKFDMQNPGDPLIEDAIAATIVAALKWLDAIKEREAMQKPVTQAELDRAGEKAKEWKALLVEERNG